MSIRKLGHTFSTNFIGDNTIEGKRAPKGGECAGLRQKGAQRLK